MTDLSLRYLLFGEDRTATSTIGKVGGAFTKMGSAIGGEFGEILDKVGEGIDKIGEHAKGAGAKLTATGGVVTGIGAALQFIGSADKQAADQLKQAVTASGHSYEDYAKSVEGAIKHQENFGHSAVDTQTALRVLTQATNDPKKALSEMGLVANLAAAKHISLADASMLVAKILGGKGSRTLAEYGITMQSAQKSAIALQAAERGHENALTAVQKAQAHLTMLLEIDHAKKKLTIADEIRLQQAHEAVDAAQQKVIETTASLAATQKDQVTASGAATSALDQLAKKTDGQAKASVDNFGAKVGILRTKLADWAAVMGQKLGPALTVAGPALMVVGSVMEIMRARQAAAATATAANVVATEAETVAASESKIAMAASAVVTGVWTAAQWLLNAALDANPIALVVIGIAALVAGIILAYKHSATFRAIVHAAFHAVGEAFSWAWGLLKTGFRWLEDHWKLILSILTGPFGAAVIFIVSHWDQIIGFVKKLPGRIGAAAVGMWDGIKDSFRAAINWLIDKWNDFHLTLGGGSVMGISIPSITLNTPNIPHLALGAVVRRPTLAVVGDNPVGEAIVPLNHNSLAGLGGGGGVTEIRLYIDGREIRTTQKRQTRLVGGIA